MHLFSEEEVRQLLPIRDCIEVLREAFRAYAAGQAQNQPRRRLRLPTGSVLHSMAGAYAGYFGTKVYATNPRHGAHFFFLLFDADTARPLARLEANHLGQIRTGAATGLAVEVLAPADAASLAVIGSGFQARTQVEAVRAVRPIRSVRVWSRTREKRERFAQEVGGEGSDTAERALDGADIVVTATSSKDPVLEASWVRPGALVCAVGSNDPARRELPADLVRQATVVADDVEQCRIEAGDLLLALDESGWSRVIPLPEVVAGKTKPGDERRRVTVFKSVGLGLEDVAAGALVFERAIPARSSAGPNHARR